MSDEIKDKDGLEEEISADFMENEQNDDTSTQHSDYKPVNRFDASAVHHLSGMYQNWFLDYASYVILERAVPHIEDGLKPVQRRIQNSSVASSGSHSCSILRGQNITCRSLNSLRVRRSSRHSRT